VAGDWIELHSDKLRNLKSSPFMFRVFKLTKIKRAGRVARMGIRARRIGYWWKSQKERDY
jgi:hypothetical protein